MTTSIDAVLFDVGGPIDTEVESERMIDAVIVEELARAGVTVTPDQYAAANRYAVESFAPDAYSAIIFRLARDFGVATSVRRRLVERMHGHRALELRDGIADVLAWLHGRGLKLGLAANQPAEVLPKLDAAGVGRYFHHREVTGVHGYRKPDVRLFLRACDDLGVTPERSVMVGDRIDNDIYPAASLGMNTILFRTGRHIEQQPRSPDEVPGFQVFDVDGLRWSLEKLV